MTASVHEHEWTIGTAGCCSEPQRVGLLRGPGSCLRWELFLARPDIVPATPALSPGEGIGQEIVVVLVASP